MNLRKPIWFLFLAGIATIIWTSPTLLPEMKLLFTEMRLFWIGLLLGFLGGDFLSKQGVTSENPYETYGNQEETYLNPIQNLGNPMETLPKPINKGGRPKKTQQKPRGYTLINKETNETYGNFSTIEEVEQAVKLRRIFNGQEQLAIKETA